MVGAYVFFFFFNFLSSMLTCSFSFFFFNFPSPCINIFRKVPRIFLFPFYKSDVFIHFFFSFLMLESSLSSSVSYPHPKTGLYSLYKLVSASIYTVTDTDIHLYTASSTATHAAIHTTPTAFTRLPGTYYSHPHPHPHPDPDRPP